MVDKFFTDEPHKVKSLIQFFETKEMKVFAGVVAKPPCERAAIRRATEWQVAPKVVPNKVYAGTWPPRTQRVRNNRSTLIRTSNLIEVRINDGVLKFKSLNQLNKTEGTKEEEEIELELSQEIENTLHHVLAELIKTEENYVENLRTGIEKYCRIFKRKDLPTGLRGKKFVLFGNIEAIYEFHCNDFLPMLYRNQGDLKRLFKEFEGFIDKNDFYGYVIYTMNHQSSLDIRKAHKNYFNSIQKKFRDDLGINSFLVQPIQRIGRYPLILKQFINTLLKKNIKAKPLLEACCHLDTKVRTVLTTANESEMVNDIEDSDKLNIFSQGTFRKVSEFTVYDHSQKRSYRSKVFFFDKCIIYTEIKRKTKSLICHGLYSCDQVSCCANMTFFTLFSGRRKQQECVFQANPEQVTDWLDLMRVIGTTVHTDSSSTGSSSDSDDDVSSSTTWYY